MDTGDYKKASTCYLIGNIFNKGIAFLTVPIFTRILSTSDYGIVTTYNSWIGIVSMLLGFALHMAIRSSFIDYRPTEKFPQARIDRVDMQYLYNDGDLFYFMNVETYDQVALNEDTIGDALKFVKDNEMVKVCSINGDVFAVEPPLFVELEITETEPGFKGDTAQGATKPATVETGANVNVPLFVERGDKIKIDTRTGEYLSRV